MLLLGLHPELPGPGQKFIQRVGRGSGVVAAGIEEMHPAFVLGVEAGDVGGRARDREHLIELEALRALRSGNSTSAARRHRTRGH